MKVFDVIQVRQTPVCSSGGGTDMVWRVLPDSVVMKSHNPFFVPDFPGGVTAFPAVVLKVSRLGKYVEERFAGRYFSEMAPAVIFRAEEYARSLRSAGLPEDAAFCFDQALAAGAFVEKDVFCGQPLDVSLSDGTDTVETRVPDPDRLFGSVISAVSRRNTLKMGDMVVCASPLAGIMARADVPLTASLKCAGKDSAASVTLSVK